MATRYPSDYDNRSRVEPGISRQSPNRAPQRSGYSGQRPPQRSSGQRPPQRSSGQHPGASRRPPQRPAGRSSRGRKRPPNRMPAILALAAVLVIVLVLVIVKPFGRPKVDPVVANVPATPASDVPQGNGGVETAADGQGEAQAQYDNLQDALADEEYNVGSLAAEEMAQVTDLSINANLPSEWLNVLLMGTDERYLSDSARTDALIICSVNRNTGEVKLSSIMRDLAVELKDIGKYSGTYRINSASFFGGPNLAMRTVNENFKMNIQYYVMVNFFGFQRIAERLGGIDIDITEEEMNQINKWAGNAWKIAKSANIDVSDVEWVELKEFGENVHLNGTQTLAYARIRKLNGGDYMRAQRQRTVLQKLLEKAKKLDAIQLAALASEMLGEVKTNLPFDDMFAIALQVCGNGLGDVESLRLPIAGSYKEERRNNKDMLYDCDFEANALELYNFIYEK